MRIGFESTRRLSQHLLGLGRAATEHYYDGLRALGIPPTPADRPGFLFAPNPVVLPRSLVQRIHEDLVRFCEIRLEETPSAQELVETMPQELRSTFATLEIAEKILTDLRVRAPFACIDCFLVEHQGALEPRYLEWQTFPTYPATAVLCLETLQKSFPEIEARGGHFSPLRGESLEQLRSRVHRSMVGDIEDSRQVVIVDYEPASQETSFEFDSSVRLTGGKSQGMGVIDPRQIQYQDGAPHYSRDGEWIPIKAVFSRLVYRDIQLHLMPQCSVEERSLLSRFFNDTENVAWRVHPLHFLYGTKGDLPRFGELGLSPFIPSSREVDASFLRDLESKGTTQLVDHVQKPIDGHGGADLIVDPMIAELREGALVQETITASAFHETLDGFMTPEVRVMSAPDDDGVLQPVAAFTRVKAPSEFRSNAGAIAAKNIPGTGEGYALFVDA